MRGTERYDVHVAPTARGGVSLLCTCPYAQDTVVCKHSWAALLEADRQGVLTRVFSASEQGGNGSGRRQGGSSAERRPPAEPERGWRQRLRRLGQRMDPGTNSGALAPPEPWSHDRRLVYVVDAEATLHGNGLVVQLCTERLLRDGSWGHPRQYTLGAERLARLPDERDRQVVQMLLGASPERYYGYSPQVSRSYLLPEGACDTMLRLMCAGDRCRLRTTSTDEDPQPITWDDGEPWRFGLRVAAAGRGPAYRVEGVLRRGDESMDVARPALVLLAGLLIADGRVARLDHGGAFQLLAELRAHGHMTAPASDVGALLEALYALPRVPPVELAPELGITESAPEPGFALRVGAPVRIHSGNPFLPLSVRYHYDEVEIDAGHPGQALFDSPARRVLRRDSAAEERALARLRELGARPGHDRGSGAEQLTLSPRRLGALASTLTGEGWRVEAEGRLYRQPGATRSAIRSGVDWFELDAAVSYGDQEAPLPRLLAALRRGERTVVLDDGSLGVLPEEWLRRYAPLAAAARQGVADAGEVEGALYFSRSQVALLDAMLEEMPEVRQDRRLAHARATIERHRQVAPAQEPRGFRGVLRPYQREGLGWMHYLRRLGFGGCLADDMGLGKTIQVLALLEARRASRSGPSLVVVPRSLVFNWMQEAARFAPKLRVVDHTGSRRDHAVAAGGGYDVLMTTYGTLRRDVATLREVEFDYVILDEAQAIRNHQTASAKAARLLRARHRLAMSGTPVENRLEELWSLFEFLNPGMLGPSRLFAAAGSGTSVGDEESRRLLGRALRPFILRRTKSQVAADLPEKQEQTLYVSLGARQRRLYDELRDHYRASLLGVVDRVGMKRARIQVLEALLRLRQAACHPALLDSRRAGDPSAKLDALVPMLAEAAADGHKALVFSQFTSFLALLRQRLDADGVGYEYLDGRTRDRQARVERFQRDPECRLFLISLKAGGQGLNLTAADYVFLLDPWWNPAVEAQAMDRAHRIGQRRPVFATRIIARDTVEERVLELQRSKRELADAVITADNSVLARMEREELELLLG